jgi:hypothetical protein
VPGRARESGIRGFLHQFRKKLFYQIHFGEPGFSASSLVIGGGQDRRAIAVRARERTQHRTTPRRLVFEIIFANV